MIRHFSSVEVSDTRLFPPLDFSGVWKDANGSMLTLGMNGTELAGIYTADFHRNGTLEDFPLVGHAGGDMVSFSVNFASHGALAAFVGQLQESPRFIKAVWMLTETVIDANNGSEIVGAVLTGSSEFRPVPP